MTILATIKSLLKSGDVAGAEALCRKALETHPDDAQLKMLFGLCRQLQGDEETFRRIHDELALEMGGAEDTAPYSEKVSLWRKYHKLWLSLIVGSLVLGGTVVGSVVLGRKMQHQMVCALYTGPVSSDMKRVERACNSSFEKAVPEPGSVVCGGDFTRRTIATAQANASGEEGSVRTAEEQEKQFAARELAEREVYGGPAYWELRRKEEERARKAAEEEARRKATEDDARRKAKEEESRRYAAEEGT